MSKFMDTWEYAEQRIALEHAVVDTYEKEAEERDIINLEFAQLMERLRENRMKLEQLHKRKEKERKDLQKAIARLEKDYNGKEVVNG